ncbi:intracellular signaling protein [Stutzerimonas stutzeri]|uniref:cyclic-guanylate-specific phosphodiesterase n=1 Tax=Stutzerimonas stutzeri TaxID=316 RepID=A0A2N8T842_STUST|nr:EAL domain-containing protein [Stutzerimonas stutzeri]MCQ4324558.1 EAL domain-containing protein [Stutzerimonas stutzeri]PNG10911.1 intracellular signaling protein [Stutzerimonas stutzeri]
MPSARELMDLTGKAIASLLRAVPLAEQASLICQEIERIAPDAIAFILRIDEQGMLRPLAGSGLSARQIQALEGLAGDGLYGCTAPTAIEVATPRSLHAITASRDTKCFWAAPILSGDGRVLAVLAVQPQETAAPTPLHRQLIETCLPLCALALEREENRARIDRLAFYDDLTGLPNRSLLGTRAAQTLVQARCDKRPLAVMLVDLDRFKRINHCLGRTGGDELLSLVAQRLGQEQRICDIVAHLSADTFALVLPWCDAEQAAASAQRLLSILSRPCRIADVPLVLSACLGISLFPTDGEEIDTLVQRADIALQRAKACGLGRFCFFSEEQMRSPQDLALEDALRMAIEQNQLQLHYQPQVCFEDGRLRGVEALARWHHPQLGNISPAHFVALAEQCGLIDELGRWVLHEACRQLAEWRRRGLAVPTISVNLSPSNFQNPELPATVAHALARHGVPAAELTLEITESVLMDTTPVFLATLQEIHAQGVSLSMDDFGTGFSSLSHLHRLPVQELKLDRAFVCDLERDAASRTLSEAVLRLGESLQLSVVAEGIETEAQRCILARMGYRVGQGYLFSAPLPPAKLEAWLASRAGQARRLADAIVPD